MPLVMAAHQELTVSLGEEPLWLSADGARVTQAILNLLVNASKFTPAGGSIRISATRDGRFVSCAIRDSGIGIDERHLATVFDMFSQAEPALERTTGGLGIGLALVRGLVELHGGSVTAFSAGPGTGSEFVVRMPLAEPPSSQPVAAPLTGNAEKGNRAQARFPFSFCRHGDALAAGASPAAVLRSSALNNGQKPLRRRP